MLFGGSGSKIQMMERQAVLTVSTPNPVTATKYTVLDTTSNVEIVSICSQVTWAVTQPSPIDVTTTIDGVAIIYRKVDPVTATNYFARRLAYTDIQQLQGNDDYGTQYLDKGRSVKIEHEVVWATTQPNPLVTRLVYRKIP